jgi:hypothetical protein
VRRGLIINLDFNAVYSFAKGMTCIQMHHCLFHVLLVMISDATLLASITVQFH